MRLFTAAAATLLLLSVITTTTTSSSSNDDDGTTLRRLVAQATSSGNDDPAAQFALGQHYRYSCPCQALAAALPAGTDCQAYCSEEAFRLYALTRDVVLDLSSRTMLSIRFDYVGMLNDLGLMLAERGRVGDAFEVYHEALALAPRHMPALANLANLEQVRTICNPPFPASHPNKPSPLTPAHPHTRQLRGNITGARAVFELAVEADPTSAAVHHNFGVFLQVTPSPPLRPCQPFPRP